MEIFKSIVKGEQFWSQLLIDIKQFQEAALYSNGIQLEHDYGVIFKHLFQKYSLDQRISDSLKMRVYINGVMGEESLELMNENPPKDDETLSDWGEHLFKSKPWCLVLDKASGCIDEITTSVSKWIAPLMDLYPTGSMVVDISPYIGKYGFTPFGAHIDVPGISILHLHLGPHEKEMTVWRADDFKALTGSDASICPDFEPYLADGTTYKIQAGDIFHLPAGTHYHIGKADEFSIGLTIGLKMDTPKNILQKAIKEHQKKGTELDPSDIVEIYKLKKKSNAGFMKTPVLKDASVSDLVGKKIKIKNPFPLLVKRREMSQLDLYVRGRMLSIEDESCIDFLNQGQTIELREDFFTEHGLNYNKSLNLMVQLYNYGGVVLV